MSQEQFQQEREAEDFIYSEGDMPACREKARLNVESELNPLNSEISARVFLVPESIRRQASLTR